MASPKYQLNSSSLTATQQTKDERTCTPVGCVYGWNGFSDNITKRDNIRVILGSYGDDGKEHENYHNGFYKVCSGW